MAKLIIFTSMIVTYAYAAEFFLAWYSGNPAEWGQFKFRATGDYALFYWIMVFCNSVVPILLWFKGVRRNIKALFIISIFINIGMWFERFNIIVTSLSRDYLPSSWGSFSPTAVDILTFAGSVGLFLTLFLLFLRFLPVIAISEVKGVMSSPAKAVEQERGVA